MYELTLKKMTESKTNVRIDIENVRTDTEKILFDAIEDD